jgi:radical SAM protein with 4Fe4S-binding SPASM domain
MVIPAGNAADRAIQVPYSRIGEIVLRVRETARQCGVEFLWYSPTPMCIFNPLAMGLGNKSCAACDGLLSVSPAGDVLPCSSYAEPVGNLLEQPFEEVWNGARAAFFRRKDYAPTECAGCEDFVACAGGCPLYWSAVGTAELSVARRLAHATA